MENNMTMDEKLFEALLKIATDEAVREEMEALPTDEELNKMYPRTKSLDKKVNAVLAREFRAARRKKALRMFAQIAAGFSVFAVVSSIVLLSVEASRNFILNSIIDMRGDYVAIDFGDASTTEGGEIILGYLPEGFEFASRQILEELTITFFTDEAGHMIIVQQFVGESLSMGADAEYTDFSEVQLSGGSARIFETFDESGHSKVMLERGSDVISIATTLDVETLITIAENLIMD